MEYLTERGGERERAIYKRERENWEQREKRETTCAKGWTWLVRFTCTEMHRNTVIYNFDFP